jgi:hypothetical protein
MKLNSNTAHVCDTIILILEQLRGTGFKEKQGAVIIQRVRGEYGSINLRVARVL